MNTNMNELNLNEMAMVNGGGDTMDHVAGAIMGTTAGAMVGFCVGSIAGAPGCVVGMVVGGTAGGVTCGILGITKVKAWFQSWLPKPNR